MDAGLKRPFALLLDKLVKFIKLIFNHSLKTYALYKINISVYILNSLLFKIAPPHTQGGTQFN